jgi:hypothetical protein
MKRTSDLRGSSQPLFRGFLRLELQAELPEEVRHVGFLDFFDDQAGKSPKAE